MRRYCWLICKRIVSNMAFDGFGLIILMIMVRFTQMKYILLLLIVPLLLASTKDGRVLYRYKNSEGNTVIGYSVPPKFAASGYEVISQGGRVLEVVERQLSNEEIDTLSAEEKARRMDEADQQEQIARDERLLLRYSSIADIEDAMEREMRELRIRLGILHGTISGLKSKIEKEQRRAANIERSGRSVPQAIQDNIKAIRLELKSATESVEKRKGEIDVVRQAYKKDMDRFTYITEELGYRR